MNKDRASLKEVNAHEFRECRYGRRNKHREKNGDNCVATTGVRELPEQEGCCSCGHWKNAHPFNSSYGIKFCFHLFFNFFFFFYFTILYWFCHMLTWICHGCTWVPNPEPPSHLPPHIISLEMKNKSIFCLKKYFNIIHHCYIFQLCYKFLFTFLLI